MVMPDRDVPGTRASAWATPMRSAAVTVMLPMSRYFSPHRSAQPRSRP